MILRSAHMRKNTSFTSDNELLGDLRKFLERSISLQETALIISLAEKKYLTKQLEKS